MTTLREDFKQGVVDDSPLLVGATTLNSSGLTDLGVVTGGSGTHRKLILDPAGVNGDPEIVYVTSHVALATAATIERGREGTTAREHPSGTVWKHGPTAVDYSAQVGEVKLYAGSTAPERWVFCRGQELNRAAYNRLFAIIGETFGVGDGVNTFNVPDLQGKFPVGVSATPGDYDLADTGGEETHVLTEAELAAHTHAVADHSHTIANHSHTTPNHSHTTPTHTHTTPNHSHSISSHSHTSGSLAVSNTGAHEHLLSLIGAPASHSHLDSGFPIAASQGSPTSGGPIVSSSSAVISGDGNHVHSISGSTAGSGTLSTGNAAPTTNGASPTTNTSAPTTDTAALSPALTSISPSNTGSGTAHENRPPFLALNYMIYAGA